MMPIARQSTTKSALPKATPSSPECEAGAGRRNWTEADPYLSRSTLGLRLVPLYRRIPNGDSFGNQLEVEESVSDLLLLGQHRIIDGFYTLSSDARGSSRNMRRGRL